MSLAAVCNFLCGDALIKKLREYPGVRAAELALTDTGRTAARKKRKNCRPIRAIEIPPPVVCETRESVPKLNLLSCGRYALVLGYGGSGYSVYGGTLVTRQDGTELRLDAGGKTYSLYSGRFISAFDSCIFEGGNACMVSTVRVSMLPSGNGEMREVRLYNRSDRPVSCALHSKIEPVLRDRAGDGAHRAYSDMFFEVSLDTFEDAMIMRRITAEHPLYVSHYTVSGHKTAYNTDRRAYYGRGCKSIAVEERPVEPVLSTHTDFCIAAKGKAELLIFTVCGEDKDALVQEIRQTKASGFRAKNEGYAYALAKRLQIPQYVKETAAKLLYAAAGSMKGRGLAEKSDITRPMLCYKIKSEQSLPRLKNELESLKKLYKFDIRFNLYLLYHERHGYFMRMNEAINEMLDDLSFQKEMTPGNGVYLLNESDDLSLARLIEGSALKADAVGSAPIPQRLAKNKPPHSPAGILLPEIVRPCGMGGFTREYAFAVDLSEADTPRPWSNVIANGRIGTVITSGGGGFTFYQNSYKEKITRWSNDAVLDPAGEFVALSENGNVWSVTKKPAPAKARYAMEHGLGYTEFLCDYNAVRASQKVYIAREKAVKFYDITLENCADEERLIEAMFAADIVLGDFSENTAHALTGELMAESRSARIENRVNGLSAYMHCSEKLTGFSSWREAYTDAEGNLLPLDASVKGSRFFPAVTAKISVPPNQTRRVIFAMGQDEAVDFSICDSVFARAKHFYANLSDIRLHGFSDEAILSRWLPYQTYSSRFMARAGFYQAGGATGFRDQLQDCLALVYVDRELARRHILACAARQFEKGDVLHWWHPPATGVRTGISDDRLWLPYVAAEYIEITGDRSILFERAPYITGPGIPEGSKDIYAAYRFTERTETLYEHILRAIRLSCRSLCKSGLCRMGTGDWNDGMDKIGEGGAGASVFTTMLLYAAIYKFLPYVQDIKLRGGLINTAEGLKKAVNAAWDGEWFLRAFTDAGLAVGSKNSDEGKIDLLVQAWAALSNAGEDEKCELALYSAQKRLVDFESGIVRLLAPPYNRRQDIGYIASYPAGVRENGGQYTHAAVWYVMALLKRGKIEPAWRVFRMLSPLSHTDTPEKVLRYGNEPYVLSADVYAGEHTKGQGGWSWYTGAAAWYYKCLVEGFLGVRLRGKKLSVMPRLPESVPEINFSLRLNGEIFHITVDNTEKTGDWRIKCGNIVFGGGEIELGKSAAGQAITVFRRS